MPLTTICFLKTKKYSKAVNEPLYKQRGIPGNKVGIPLLLYLYFNHSNNDQPYLQIKTNIKAKEQHSSNTSTPPKSPVKKQLLFETDTFNESTIKKKSGKQQSP